MKKCVIILLLMTSYYQSNSQQLDIQGHRGARGIKPENTIPAFIYALDQGVTTLELDLAITKDGKIVVSHEPWMSSAICLTPGGKGIAHEDEMSHNIFKMTYEEVKSYDCGSKGNARFPEQEKQIVSKPLLSEVIKAAEKHIKSYTQYEVDYNIEIKSSPEGDNIYHPDIAKFSDMVYDLIDQYLPMERIVIQSFDFRVLKYWNEKYPKVRLAALVENSKSIDSNLSQLGFTPAIYSPDYKLLTKKKIDQLHSKRIKVIPWTVNDTDKMKELVSWKIDGIITDYPNRAKELGLTLKFEEEN
ncbi:MAG: glycerophosphodiester phosphodiesterase family protein [Bacteroidota bacterium]